MAKTATFEWDDNTNRLNKKKHNISFEEAQYAFSDTKRIIAKDLEHSENEERWISLGISINGNLLVVVHTYKQIDDDTALIRIISARRATKNENKQYQG